MSKRKTFDFVILRTTPSEENMPGKYGEKHYLKAAGNRVNQLGHRIEINQKSTAIALRHPGKFPGTFNL